MSAYCGPVFLGLGARSVLWSKVLQAYGTEDEGPRTDQWTKHQAPRTDYIAAGLQNKTRPMSVARAFCCAGAAENMRHRVVAFVARELEYRLAVGPRQRH